MWSQVYFYTQLRSGTELLLNTISAPQHLDLHSYMTLMIFWINSNLFSIYLKIADCRFLSYWIHIESSVGKAMNA